MKGICFIYSLGRNFSPLLLSSREPDWYLIFSSQYRWSASGNLTVTRQVVPIARLLGTFLFSCVWVFLLRMRKFPYWSNHQSRPQSSSLSRMTEGENSSGEPWNKRLSHWFSRGTKNRHMIGLFKWKVCLTLFSASAAYYKYARKEKLFAFRNFGYQFKWN